MTPAVLSAVLADLAAKRAVVLAVDLGTGEARLVHPAEPEPGLDPALVAAARDALARDESGKRSLGGATWFLRVYNPPVRVIVVGAVHIAQSLASMVQLAGYEVIVVDPRRAFATPARFGTVPLVHEWPEEALERLRLDRRTALVTMTHDPKIDDPALVAALRSQAFYVGALGSRKTHAARRERLRALGFADADLARIHGPVGLPIGARSTGEIAVSILSQVVAALRGAARQAPAE